MLVILMICVLQRGMSTEHGKPTKNGLQTMQQLTSFQVLLWAQIQLRLLELQDNLQTIINCLLRLLACRNLQFSQQEVLDLCRVRLSLIVL
ncbi:hypothetical protein D3C86_1212740 [compost metagenome]